MRLPDEVEHREAIFLGRLAQTATELLEEHRQAFSRAQKQDCVHIRNVEALIQHVPRE